MSDYSAQREANIARNKALLESLGLDKPFFAAHEVVKKPAPAKPKAKSNPKKRKAEENADTEQNEPAKVARVEAAAPAGVRRSGRNSGKTVDYNAEVERKCVSAAVKSGLRVADDAPAEPKASMMRLHDPKTFGSIPGVPVGTWWQSRENCSKDAIHAPWVAGIAPSKQGAFSVALSGGYSDDIDMGGCFTYTGSGGRDLKGTKDAPKNLRTGPQTCDQTFDNNYNASLKRSCETKNPIRVIRGYKLKSKYAPAEGYRYDGLYRVEKAWLEEGLNKDKFMVCKYAFKRIDGQPPLPERGDAVDEEEEAAVEDDEPNASELDTEVDADKEETEKTTAGEVPAQAEEAIIGDKVDEEVELPQAVVDTTVEVVNCAMEEVPAAVAVPA